MRIVNNSNTIISRHATDWFDEEHTEPISEKYTSEIKITVQNDLDTDINADAYSVVSSVYIYYYGDEWGTKCAKTTNVPTRNIAAHSSVVLTYTYSGEGEQIEGTGWIDRVKSILSFNLQNLNVSALYTPLGGEYDEYIMNHSASND